MPKYSEYLTTQRCIRLCCALTTRLITPIEHCPRCNARMHVVEAPQRGFEALVSAATKDVLAGFESLLLRVDTGTV